MDKSLATNAYQELIKISKDPQVASHVKVANLPYKTDRSMKTCALNAMLVNRASIESVKLSACHVKQANLVLFWMQTSVVIVQGEK